MGGFLPIILICLLVFMFFDFNCIYRSFTDFLTIFVIDRVNFFACPMQKLGSKSDTFIFTFDICL